jgi:hypothetical protein
MFLVRQTSSLKKSTVTHNLELMGGIINTMTMAIWIAEAERQKLFKHA